MTKVSTRFARVFLQQTLPLLVGIDFTLQFVDFLGVLRARLPEPTGQESMGFKVSGAFGL